jgi:hypothetical protein
MTQEELDELITFCEIHDNDFTPLTSCKLTDENFNFLLKHKKLVGELIYCDILTEKQVDKLLYKKYFTKYGFSASIARQLSSKQIDKALKLKLINNDAIAANSKLNKKQISLFLNKNDEQTNYCLIINSYIDHSIKSKIIKKTIKEHVFK